MIINKSGIAIRLSVAECRVMGRNTQGVKLINLAKKNDIIAAVTKVMGAERMAEFEEGQHDSDGEAEELAEGETPAVESDADTNEDTPVEE